MAPNVTNYAEIQNDEIEALRSIYMDDFLELDIKPGAWNVGNCCWVSFSVPSLLPFHHQHASGKSNRIRLLACLIC